MYGKMLLSTKLSDIGEAIANGATVVALVDNGDNYTYLNCVIMGNLLPTYESLSAEIDGDEQLAAGLYYEYLTSKISAIANLLAAMHMGKNIMIFVPEDESMNFGFVNIFITFFVNVFGIAIGTTNPCVISNDPIFVARRADAMFVNDLLPFPEYCKMLPPNMPPSEAACGKIMQSVNYTFPSMQHCISYCSQYIEAIRKQTNASLPMGAFRVQP